MANLHPLLGDGHLRAMGLIAVIWGTIEGAMELTICKLYGVPINAGLVFTSNLGFQNRIAMLRIAAMDPQSKSPDAIAVARALIARIEHCYPLRNNAVHGLWTATNDPNFAQRMAIKVKGVRLQTISERKSVADLEADADTLLKLLGDFKSWMEALDVFPELPQPED